MIAGIRIRYPTVICVESHKRVFGRSSGLSKDKNILSIILDLFLTGLMYIARLATARKLPIIIDSIEGSAGKNIIQGTLGQKIKRND